jgi:hypothetical protein
MITQDLADKTIKQLHRRAEDIAADLRYLTDHFEPEDTELDTQLAACRTLAKELESALDGARRSKATGRDLIESHSTLQLISEQIYHFDKECEQCEETDTGEVWLMFERWQRWACDSNAHYTPPKSNGNYKCPSCNRPEADCSADPCIGTHNARQS